MSATRSGGGPDNADAGSWATESLPMSLRKELLERELRMLGFRKGAGQGVSASRDTSASQQQAESGASHPQADNDASDEHAA